MLYLGEVGGGGGHGVGEEKILNKRTVKILTRLYVMWEGNEIFKTIASSPRIS